MNICPYSVCVCVCVCVCRIKGVVILLMIEKVIKFTSKPLPVALTIFCHCLSNICLLPSSTVSFSGGDRQ